ncbi:MAG TPA: DUF2946 family protein [Rhizomicrobium sp.]|jgi:hypothetical protein|nr:DUF2946 family protein [Rhizomicrobium sp.]
MNLSPSRQFAVSLALCAMLLRALLPDGWMPAAAGTGAFFEICSVDGMHTGGSKAPAQQDQQQQHAPCAFAAVGHLSPPALSAIALAAPTVFFHVARAEAATLAPRTPPYRPNAARAPPAFS